MAKSAAMKNVWSNMERKKTLQVELGTLKKQIVVKIMKTRNVKWVANTTLASKEIRN